MEYELVSEEMKHRLLLEQQGQLEIEHYKAYILQKIWERIGKDAPTPEQDEAIIAQLNAERKQVQIEEAVGAVRELISELQTS